MIHGFDTPAFVRSAHPELVEGRQALTTSGLFVKLLVNYRIQS